MFNITHLKILPGQRFRLHSRSSVEAPTQALPPKNGPLQVLVYVWNPVVPHVAEHEPCATKAVHTPSTLILGERKKKYFLINKEKCQ